MLISAESLRSAVNKRFANESRLGGKVTPSDFSMPSWEDVELPTIRPIITDRQYLEKEHLLVSIRSQDSDESYGVFCGYY